MQKRIRNLSDREKQQIGEQEYIKKLLNLYPTGIVSVVSDTFNLWDVLTIYLPNLKEQILARDGKLVIRPDSGDPVDILCGTTAVDERDYGGPVNKGVIELLWDVFGGTYVTGNDGKQYKQLDSHIGTIYGDSITLDRAKAICDRLKAKGFASTNVVLGIGSYTYQFNTRDTFGFAMKATYGEITHRECCQAFRGDETTGKICCEEYSPVLEPREIFKDPITDSGEKRSKKGLLAVFEDANHTGLIFCKDQCTPEEEEKGLLKTVFKDGKLIKRTNLEEIRKRLELNG